MRTRGSLCKGIELNIDYGDLDDRYGTDAARRAKEQVEAAIGPSGHNRWDRQDLCMDGSSLVDGSLRLSETLLATYDQVQSVLIPRRTSSIGSSTDP
jgi:hypothetical protein